MENDQRFAETIEKIDAANREDPRTEPVDGKPQSRELLFSKRVYEWVVTLVENPSEALLLAARGHTLRRWMIPRESYPKTTPGYHQWRGALAQFHADEMETILRAAGYLAETIQAVRAFITKANWPEDREACALEDADCLVFLETKLSDYTDAWDEDKMLRVLQRTYQKMTPEGRKHVAGLNLGDRERELLRRATTSTGA